MTQEQVGVVVTLNAIYEKLLGVEQTVQRIDTTLTELSKDSEDHERRIRALETAKGKLSGVAATLGLIAGAAASFILTKLNGG